MMISTFHISTYRLDRFLFIEDCSKLKIFNQFYLEICSTYFYVRLYSTFFIEKLFSLKFHYAAFEVSCQHGVHIIFINTRKINLIQSWYHITHVIRYTFCIQVTSLCNIIFFCTHYDAITFNHKVVQTFLIILKTHTNPYMSSENTIHYFIKFSTVYLAE